MRKPLRTLAPPTLAMVIAVGLAVVGASSAGAAATITSPALTGATAGKPDTGAAFALPTVSPDGWITFHDTMWQSLGLIDPHNTTLRGTIGAGRVCSIGSTGRASVRSAPTYQEEVAYNPRSCQERVVSGGLTPAALAALNSMSAQRTTKSAAAAAPSSSGSITRQAQSKADAVTPDTTYTSEVYEKSAWIDPLDITITSFADDLKWSYDGTDWVGTAYASDHPYEFAYDGWSNSGTPPIHWTPDTATEIGMNEAETFTNTDFAIYLTIALGIIAPIICDDYGSPAVFKLHDTLTGQGNGYYDWSWNDNASGECYNLVHHAQWNGVGYKT